MMVLVVLATMAAAVVRLGWSQQVTFAQDVQTSRGSQAARAGIEWGLWQVFQVPASPGCAGAGQTLDLRAQTGFRVTVTCNYVNGTDGYSEGETAPGSPRKVKLYTIDAVACNLGTACPDNGMVGNPNYVERRRTVQVTDVF